MGIVVSQGACPECSSSDAFTVYDDDSAHCFSCGHHVHAKGKVQSEKKGDTADGKNQPFYAGTYMPLTTRKISLETAKTFGVKVTDKGNIVYPLYDKEGKLVATKIRVQVGEGEKKKFAITGDFKEATLFGQRLFGGGGKIITVTEGQDDAMAAYEMGGKFPTVSVHSASSAVSDVKRNLDFLESYDKVRICFDADEVGQEAARAVAEILSPNRAEIVTFTKAKDANEYLMKGDVKGFIADFWNAKRVSPAGVVPFDTAFSSLEKENWNELISLPKSMAKLSSKLGGGIGMGEITVIGARTSIGKSTFVHNLMFGILAESDKRVGYLGLETTVGEVARSLINLEAGRKVEDMGEARGIFNRLAWKENLFIFDHQGSLELEDLLKRVRNMVVAYELDVFILDPLQAALPDLNNDTVKLAMDRFLKLAKQTNVSLIIVSHMRKPDDDKPHKVGEYDLLGSSAINQVAFNTILLSRDKMGGAKQITNSTCLHLVKARRSGDTGEAGWLYYNESTTRFEQGVDPYEDFSE
jgi:twinkle protein